MEKRAAAKIKIRLIIAIEALIPSTKREKDEFRIDIQA